MLFLWDCNCPSILLCSVLLIQLESLVLCAFDNSTMMSIAILVLEYCKHKHGQVRGFRTILTKSNDVDKFRVILAENGVPALMCKNFLFPILYMGYLFMLLFFLGMCTCKMINYIISITYRIAGIFDGQIFR